MFSLPADHQWQYTESEPPYRCVVCGKEVRFPDTLYRDMRSEPCHFAVVA